MINKLGLFNTVGEFSCCNWLKKSCFCHNKVRVINHKKHSEFLAGKTVRPRSPSKKGKFQGPYALTANLVKSRSRETECYDNALKFGRHLGSNAAEVKKFNRNSQLRDFARSCGKTSVHLRNRIPGSWSYTYPQCNQLFFVSRPTDDENNTFFNKVANRQTLLQTLKNNSCIRTILRSL